VYQERIIKVSDEVTNWYNERVSSKGNLKNNITIEEILDDGKLYEELLAVPEVTENKEMKRVYLYSTNTEPDAKDLYGKYSFNKTIARPHSFSPVKRNRRTLSTKMPFTRKYNQSIAGSLKSTM
jgi:hypothetical protein